MIEVQGDLWETTALNICVTTNGQTRGDGSAIMGAGVARQAVERCPGIDRVLGGILRTHGNKVAWLGSWNGKKLWSFPTKQVWQRDAEPELIAASARVLTEVASGDVALPRPGCSNGGLKWAAVRKIIAPILRADRFIVTDRAPPLATPRQVDLRAGLRVAVVGSRTFPHFDYVRTMVQFLAGKGCRISSGGAAGVDSWAQAEAEEFGCFEKMHLADWDTYGRRAGPIRNQQMLEAVDAVFAFWDGMSPGTADMIDRAKAAGKILRVMLPEDCF